MFCYAQRRHAKHQSNRTYLVAADLLSDVVERLNDAQAQLLALLVLRDSNILDVADEPQAMDELALDDERARADDALRRVRDADQKVRVAARRHPRVPLVPLLFADLAHGCQHPQHVQEAGAVVAALQRPHRVALWQRRQHVWGDQARAEERLVGGGHRAVCAGHCGKLWTEGEQGVEVGFVGGGLKWNARLQSGCLEVLLQNTEIKDED